MASSVDDVVDVLAKKGSWSLITAYFYILNVSELLLLLFHLFIFIQIFFDDSFKTVYILFVLYFIFPCLGLLCAVQNESCWHWKMELEVWHLTLTLSNVKWPRHMWLSCSLIFIYLCSKEKKITKNRNWSCEPESCLLVVCLSVTLPPFLSAFLRAMWIHCVCVGFVTSWSSWGWCALKVLAFLIGTWLKNEELL